MSKSLGNFVTIDELLSTDRFGGRPWPGDVLRLAMLKTHYRQPIDWTVRALEEAERELAEWGMLVGGVVTEPVMADAVVDALGDDLNTSAMLTVLRAMTRDGQKGDVGASVALAGSLAALGFDPASLRPALSAGDTAPIAALVARRIETRRAKNFAESDRLRAELEAMGVQVKDGKDPVTGEPTTTWELRR
jgi:cysteinyl-tRNA synthetase